MEIARSRSSAARRLLLVALLMGAGVAPASADLFSDLVAYYPFDVDYSDTTGRGNDGAATGVRIGIPLVGAGSTRDLYGQIDLGFGPDLQFGTGDATVAFWTKRPDDIAAERQLLGNRDARKSTTAPHAHWQIWSNDSGNAIIAHLISTGHADGEDLVSARPLHLNEWLFVALVIDQSNSKMKLYVGREGVPDSLVARPATGVFPAGDFDRDADSVVLGAGRNDYYDELAFWKRALSAEEITELFNGGTGRSLLVPATWIPAGGGSVPDGAFLSENDDKAVCYGVDDDGNAAPGQLGVLGESQGCKAIVGDDLTIFTTEYHVLTDFTGTWVNYSDEVPSTAFPVHHPGSSKSMYSCQEAGGKLGQADPSEDPLTCRTPRQGAAYISSSFKILTAGSASNP